MKIKEERFVTWSEAKKLLEAKEKEQELGYEQKNATEFLRKFSKLSEKRTSELVEELKKIEKLKDKHIVSIVNMLPENMDDLRLLFAHEIISPSEEDRKKILSIVKKFA